MNNNYLYRIDYFNQSWTWIKRAGEALLAIFFVYWIDLQELESASSILWIGYIFAGILVAYIFLRPIDELALGQKNLYYIQKSLIPFFNRSKTYEISEIEKIESVSTSAPIIPMYGVLPSKLSKIKITTKDGLSEYRKLTIDKRELDKIVSRVIAMMQ